jgi:hypothetical protein
VAAADIMEARVLLADQRGHSVLDLADARNADVDLAGTRLPADDNILRLCYASRHKTLLAKQASFLEAMQSFLVLFCRPAKPAHSRCHH